MVGKVIQESMMMNLSIGAYKHLVGLLYKFIAYG